MFRHNKRFFPVVSLFFYDGGDLRYHVSGPLDYNRVSDPYVFSFHLVHVVKGRPLYRNASDDDRREHGDGRQRASPSYADYYVFHYGSFLLRREFVRYRPFRASRDGSQFFLKREVVDLRDYSVEFVAEFFPHPFHFPVVSDYGGRARTRLYEGVYPYAEFFQIFESFEMSFKRDSAYRA